MIRIERNKALSKRVAKVEAASRRWLARDRKSESILAAIEKNPAVVKGLLKSGGLKGHLGMSRLRLFVKAAAGLASGYPIKQAEFSHDDLSELAAKAGKLAQSREEFRAELHAAIAEGDRLLKKAGC